MRVLCYCTFLILVIFSGSSGRPSISNSTFGDSCKLYAQEFSIDISTYKHFEEPLSDFFESNNRFDGLFIKMKGGNPSASIMKRWFIENESVYKVEWSHGQKRTDLLTKNIWELLQLADLVESGDFLQLCPYSTNNDSYLILFKHNSVVKFKFSSTSKDYQALPDNDRNRISNVINLLAFLDSSGQE